jgi:CheY-like chemotaxis protein
MKILIADDYRTIRTFVKLCLQTLYVDAAFVEVSDGRSALAIAQREHFDLIVTDLRMPGLDGLEVARALRSVPATAKIPIVICTSDRDPAIGERAVAVRVALSYKPVTPSILGDVRIAQDIVSGS